MKCPKCNNTVSDNDRFCSKCGSPLYKSCSRCKLEMKLSEQFCPNCGFDNSEDFLSQLSVQKNKKKKTRKIVLIIIISLLGVFLVLQGISMIQTLKHFKETKPIAVMYQDKIDERTGEPHYLPAYLYCRLNKGHYTINLVDMISGWPKYSDKEISIVENGIQTGTSEFIYFFREDNKLFIDSKDVWYIHLSDWYAVYQDDVKFIKFAWFWDHENGKVILKSGVKIDWYWSLIPFTIDGKVILNGQEVGW